MPFAELFDEIDKYLIESSKADLRGKLHTIREHFESLEADHLKLKRAHTATLNQRDAVKSENEELIAKHEKLNVGRKHIARGTEDFEFVVEIGAELRSIMDSSERAKQNLIKELGLSSGTELQAVHDRLEPVIQRMKKRFGMRDSEVR